jgi:two-component system sensor histidine kinase KdpD
MSPAHIPVVVCINDHPGMDMLLRAAAAEAESTRQVWYALYVETPRGEQTMSPRKAERLLRTLTQAEQLGAAIAKTEAKTVSAGIIAFIKGLEKSSGNLPILVIGKTARDGLWPIIRPALADRIGESLRGEIQLRIIPLPRFVRPVCIRISRNLYWGNNWRNMLAACAAIVVTLAIGTGLRLISPYEQLGASHNNASILFLLACVFVTGRYGLLPGLLAAVLGFATVNLLYTGAYAQLRANPADFTTLVLFLIASLAIATNTAYTMSFARFAQQQEQRTNALYRINRMAFSALTLAESLHILHRELRHMLQKDIAYFLPDALQLDHLVPAAPEKIALTAIEQQALNRCWRESMTTGVGTSDPINGEWRFEPMITPRDRIGILGVRIRPNDTLDPLLGRTLSLLAHQSAVVIERLELARAMEQSRLQRERERLRSNLLSSVSHDLKTPLASIIGALSVCHTMKAHLTEERKEILTQTALEEAQRLNSFISNIIDMARLESGETGFHPEWQPPQDLILRVKRTLRHRLKGHEIVITASGSACEIFIDVAQTEQALQNIFDNAIKYSAPGTPIEVGIADHLPDSLEITVRDYGPGIPEAAQMTIFDKYTRLTKEDSQVAGTGLGLAIARAIIEQQQGRLGVHNHPEGGAVFVLRFSQVRRPLSLQEEQIA